MGIWARTIVVSRQQKQHCVHLYVDVVNSPNDIIYLTLVNFISRHYMFFFFDSLGKIRAHWTYSFLICHEYIANLAHIPLQIASQHLFICYRYFIGMEQRQSINATRDQFERMVAYKFFRSPVALCVGVCVNAELRASQTPTHTSMDIR